MTTIDRVEIGLVNLEPKVLRTDAIQTFEVQETPVVTVYDSDGGVGIGYSYTIGSGGPSVIALLEKTLAPALIGRDPACIGGIWYDLLRRTNATSVGAITSLALAAIDTALWDLSCRRAGQPLWKAAGGARDHVEVYSTEGGWLHLDQGALIEDAVEKKQAGFKGAKLKIGRPGHEDAARLNGVRKAAGDDFQIMTDANQAFSLSEAIRRASILEDHGVAWFEEPLPADRVRAHTALAQSTNVPIAVGESMYSLSQFNEYLANDAASIVQADVARIGGITPWLKVAALAEAYGVAICPHFLMELHVSLVCAVPNAPWLEYIPQLDAITQSEVEIRDGIARPSNAPGLGIDWDHDALRRLSDLALVVDSPV
ncbi:mandelate racemase/muconate lactonizing enzyme family protein [Pelagovum pacificum]|uniref:Mandelate racemase/muconate lactonizing enzyme family protein n=1 Tax=Pelagovum pacificum TaxID=2588711 RepID=A0A5C5GCL9_9RHOB|nr:mandelate racemase/muconate lactonizing enzyme family protein [Pelagovum pacificum]QQA41460.1 mandelate racemase/muconate lactonizing enzyme family protein [Pelagovum pacificum]TNY31737.1 mandelate racemase/muconate lactonizing enzyme family protein [Pelagovum pacificum]